MSFLFFIVIIIRLFLLHSFPSGIMIEFPADREINSKNLSIKQSLSENIQEKPKTFLPQMIQYENMQSIHVILKVRTTLICQNQTFALHDLLTVYNTAAWCFVPIKHLWKKNH